MAIERLVLQVSIWEISQWEMHADFRVLVSNVFSRTECDAVRPAR